MHQVVQVADQAPIYVKWKSAAPCGITARGSTADTVWNMLSSIHSTFLTYLRGK